MADLFKLVALLVSVVAPGALALWLAFAATGSIWVAMLAFFAASGLLVWLLQSS